MKIMRLESHSPAETEEFARQMGLNAKPGEVYCLEGTLGAGKTVFARGFARGVGYEGLVTSPTFTIINVYESGRLPLYHFDLYRLEEDSDDLESIGLEDYFHSDGVCLVEWPRRLGDYLPREATKIEIIVDFDKGSDYREIVV